MNTIALLATSLLTAGTGYLESYKLGINAPYVITVEYEGKGYSDSEWAGRNPPNSENEEGEAVYEPNEDPDGPCYDYKAAQQVFTDDDNHYILEDNGDITVIER